MRDDMSKRYGFFLSHQAGTAFKTVGSGANRFTIRSLSYARKNIQISDFGVFNAVVYRVCVLFEIAAYGVS